ncbi:unnamed protein product [Trichogramma brassicae]|uniref:Uncharacterized protein n=1 Tax=Trichogramma brassicae TaxID=86971 RepID=A0A6H5I2L7_9HYME|nr:unnamed protein product [Trichogramma brassicae]
MSQLNAHSDGKIRAEKYQRREPQTELHWIQSLQGKYPREKGKFYQIFAPYASIISVGSERPQNLIRMNLNNRQPYHLSTELARARLRVHIGKQLRIDELIIEGLLWPVKCIVKLALSADWFFKADYYLTEPDFYIAHILTRASARTFRAVMFKLAKTLRFNRAKAESFYEKVSRAFDEKRALPLLLACKHGFTLEALKNYKTPLTRDLMKKLCRQRPILVMDYSELDTFEILSYYERVMDYGDIQQATDWLQTLFTRFDLTTLDENSWTVLMTMIHKFREEHHRDLCRDPEKKTLANLLVELLKIFLVVKEREDKLYGCLFAHLYLIEIDNWCWPLKNNQTKERDYLEKLFSCFSQYVLGDMISWSRLPGSTRIKLMRAFRNAAKSVNKHRSKYGPDSIDLGPFVELYDHVMRSMIDDDLEREINSKELRKLLPPETFMDYELKSAERPLERIPVCRLGLLLKHKRPSIWLNWTKYFEVCRNVLSSRSDCEIAWKKSRVAQFLKSIKWYYDLPIRYVEKCSDELLVPGSVEVLSYLVDGPTFQEIVTRHLFENEKPFGRLSQVHPQIFMAIAESMPRVESPVTLSFAIEFFSLCEKRSNMPNAFASLLYRWPMDQVKDNLPRLADSPKPVRMAFVEAALKVMPERCVIALFESAWMDTNDDDLRWKYGKLLIQYFKETRNMSFWKLLETCVRYLNVPRNEVYI